MTDYANLTTADLQNMSDEDFAALDPAKFPDVEAEPATPPAEEPEPTEPVTTVVEEPVTPTTPPVESDGGQPATPNEDESAANIPHAGDGAAQPTEPVELNQEQQFFNQVTASFKANGKEFKVDKAEDVIALMQQGLNYNSKMAAMKPGMKLIKALQDKGISSVEQLGNLFDLMDKKPEAIARLIQESGIDSYELNEEKAQAYVPSVPEVSDATIEFEMVARSLESRPEFGTVVKHMAEYDNFTKQEIFNKPHLMELLTKHVEEGFYDQICARLEQERALGRMQGVPFIQAYDTVGNMMFGQPQPAVATQPVPVAPVAVPVPVASQAKPVDNPARAAAAPSGSTAVVSKSSLTPEDLWKMSAEDFRKLNVNDL